MQEFLDDQRGKIETVLSDFILNIQAQALPISPWAADLGDRLLPYTKRGKMIRGTLVALGLRVFKKQAGQTDRDNAVILGAVMELLQALLLIHDDIMDQDEIRRGRQSVHFQYESLARSQGIDQPKRLGESLGICLGDIAGFLAFELISRVKLPGPLLAKILQVTSRELTYVGVAQMSDVYTGHHSTDVSEASIMSLYRFKTGRYSFSLPLLLGALLAKVDDQTCRQVAELGELLGVLFQIKDDEIGLFGSPEATGKPRGSDIRANKKTVYRFKLLAAASKDERAWFQNVFGNPTVGTAEIEQVLSSLTKWGIHEQVMVLAQTVYQQAKDLIGTMVGSTAQSRQILESVLQYNLTRQW